MIKSKGGRHSDLTQGTRVKVLETAMIQVQTLPWQDDSMVQRLSIVVCSRTKVNEAQTLNGAIWYSIPQI